MSESQIEKIKGLHRFGDINKNKYKKNPHQKMNKSAKSINPIKSVIKTNYDIVKAHGRELKVETKAGDGTTFIIDLPA